MVKVIQERDKCIGCGACISVDEKHWKMDDDGKATLIGGTEKGGVFEKELDEPGEVKEAEEVCPVQIIHVED